MGKALPTIADVHAYLGSLIEAGLADAVIQVVVAPSSTVQAIARATGDRQMDAKPAQMIQGIVSDLRLPVTIVTTDHWAEGPTHGG